MLQKLGSRDHIAVGSFYHFSYFLNNINNPLIFFKSKFGLGVISKNGGLAFFKGSGIWFQFTRKNVKQGRFSHAIWPDNTNTVLFFKHIREIVQHFFIAEGFADMRYFQNFAALR